MSLTTLFAVGFLTILMLALAIGSYRTHIKEQEQKKRPKLIIAKEYRRRQR